LRFFFFFFFGAVLALLLDDDREAARAPPADPYPSQSGIEIHPSSRYAVFGWDGMVDGRSPDLLHACHSLLLLSLSFRAITLATMKASILPRAGPVYPSQSGIEIQPSSRYTCCGLDGMLEGRMHVSRHACHSRLLLSLSFRANTLANMKESILPRACPSYPSQSGREIQPSSRYTWCGEDGMLEGRCPDLRHSLHSGRLFSLSFRTIALAAAKESMRLVPLFPSPSASFTATRGIDRREEQGVVRPRAPSRASGRSQPE